MGPPHRPAPGAGPFPLAPAADPAAGPRWAAALAAVAALLRAGWSPGQLRRLAHLRGRVRRGDYTADGVAGRGRPPVTNAP
jgi:hypothetical protein